MDLQFNTNQILKTLIVIVGIIFLRWLLVRITKKVARRFERVEHRTGLIIKYLDFSAIFLIILGLILIWGVDVKNLSLVLSSVFAVVGIGFFAQWSILSNITSGVIMFFTFPYKIGDYIKIHDKEFPYEGVIEDIKTFHLILRTSENEIVTYPNSMTLQKGITVIKPEEISTYIQEHEEAEKDPLKDHATD